MSKPDDTTGSRLGNCPLCKGKSVRKAHGIQCNECDLWLGDGSKARSLSGGNIINLWNTNYQPTADTQGVMSQWVKPSKQPEEVLRRTVEHGAGWTTYLGNRRELSESDETLSDAVDDMVYLRTHIAWQKQAHTAALADIKVLVGRIDGIHKLANGIFSMTPDDLERHGGYDCINECVGVAREIMADCEQALSTIKTKYKLEV